MYIIIFHLFRLARQFEVHACFSIIQFAIQKIYYNSHCYLTVVEGLERPVRSFKISPVVIPAHAAVEHKAPLTE